jgi:hypothetical protein
MISTATSVPAAAAARAIGLRQGAAGGPVTGVDPATQALLDLYLAHRRRDEDHRQCFARLGARTYAALLDEALSLGRDWQASEAAQGPA